MLYSGRIDRYKNIDLLARLVKVLNEKYGMGLELKVFGRRSYVEGPIVSEVGLVLAVVALAVAVAEHIASRGKGLGWRC